MYFDACLTLLSPDLLNILPSLRHPPSESLIHLVKAIIWSSGPIPRPGGGGNNASGGAGGSGGNWDVSELCLELLFTVLLRNRDRISLLWSRIYEHFHVRVQ